MTAPIEPSQPTEEQSIEEQLNRPDVARAGNLQTGRELTDRKTGGQSNPERLLMGPDQLLPHEKDGGHIQSICHKLVNYHQNNGDITGT